MHRPLTRPRPPTTSSRSGTLLTVAVALLLATLLNAEAMERTASGSPLGWRRDVALDVLTPLADFTRFTGLDAPRRALDQALNREPTSPAPTPPTPPAPTAQPSPSPQPRPTSSPTPPAHRTPTATDPLRIEIIGDSMAQATGESLIALAQGTGVVRAVLDFRFSSGLSRPDFFDWPGHLAQLLAPRSRPDVVVVTVGANDAQGMIGQDGVLDYGTQAWKAEYAARVGALMNQLHAAGTDVYWIGQPIARSPSYSQRMAELDAIYRAQAARHPGVTYIDSWSHFTTANGGYSDYLATPSGPQLMRLSDGIHLSRAGGDRLAAVVLAAIRHDWRLPP